VVRGPLRDFPFDRTHSGRFEVLFDTEDMVLDYWPGWPVLTNVRAEVRFLNNSFDTWLSQGTLFDSRIRKAHGRIRDLARSAPFELEGEVEGPLHDNLRLLRESPHANNFAPVSQGVQGEGNSRTQLSFAVPLKRSDPFRLDGKLSFNGSSLHLEQWQLPLEDIQGDRIQSGRPYRNEHPDQRTWKQDLGGCPHPQGCCKCHTHQCRRCHRKHPSGPALSGQGPGAPVGQRPLGTRA